MEKKLKKSATKAQKLKNKKTRHREHDLDEALKETFPASDATAKY